MRHRGGPRPAAGWDRVRAVSAPHTLQLDLFRDSRETILVNDLRLALSARRTDEAQELLARCRAEYPAHPQLTFFGELLTAAATAEQPVTDVEAETECMLRVFEPAAHAVLGADAPDFLRPLWRRLAAVLAGRAFDPAHPRLHASFAAAQAEDWAAARFAVEGEVSWRAEPELLLRHAVASEQLDDAGAALADWCLLCWEHPEVDARALGGSRLLAAQWRAFGELDAGLPAEDFPAWLALEGEVRCPLPAQTLNARARESAEIVYRLTAHASAAPGPETLADRKLLRELNPALFALYMEHQRRRDDVKRLF